MTKDNNIDITKLPILNVGMAGHIDHGKTTLLYALSGKFTDTHSEELKRGITIKLGYSDIILRKNKNGSEYGVNEKDGEPYRYITFVDVPGHEMLMATMLSGAAIADNSPIIPVSAQQKINIDKVYKILAEAEIPLREVKSEPVFIIARSFDINKPGTSASELHGGVLGGSLMKGILKVGDEIEIKPGLNVIEKNQKIYETVKTRIVSLQRGEHKVKEAGPGGSLAIETELDMTLTKADNLSGCVAGLNGKLPDISHNIKIKAQHFKEVLGMEEHVDVEDFKPSEMLMLSVNTSISVGRVKTVKDGILDLELNIPIVPFKEDNVGIARNIKGHWRLIGFGEMI